jgi:L-threonylcarbamoyladenylate synthase
MEEIKLDSMSPQTISEALEKSQTVLKNGEIIIYPTDTLYGLGANALDENAIAKIYRIKQRDLGKPISILVRDISMAKRVACIDSKAEKLLEKLWPDSITVILRKKDAIPYLLTAGEENVAVRAASSPFAQELLQRVDFPLTATSANLSGEENLYSAQEIRAKFETAKYAPELFVNGGDLDQRLPSTIIDLTDVNHPRIKRLGIVGKDKLDAFFKNFT